mgnify:CR=1 FL=1
MEYNKLSAPLKIALVLDDYYPSSSGVSRSIQSQIDELSAMGHQVTLIAPEKNFTPPKNAEHIALKSVQPPGALKHTTVLSSSAHVAKLIAKNHQFDIIHSQTDTGALILSARIARMQQIPHVHTFHTNMAGSVPYYTKSKMLAAAIAYRLLAFKLHLIRRQKPIRTNSKDSIFSDCSHFGKSYWRSQALMANAVDAIVTPSQYMLKYIQAASPNKQFIKKSIPNGYNKELHKLISNTAVKKDRNTVRFISIGRISNEKRIDTMVKAFKMAKLSNAELVLIGDGNQMPLIKQLATDTSNIKLLGQVHRLDDIAKHLKSSDVFVLTSYHFDNQPMVILEALAAELPILYCDDQLDVGVDKTNSIRTLPSASAISEGMRLLAGDTTLRNQLSRGSKQKCEQLSAKIMTEKYISLYRELMS